MLPIDNYCKYYKKTWLESPTGIPDFPRAYCRSEQIERENYYRSFQEKLNGLKVRKKNVQEQVRTSFFPHFKRFLECVFDFEEKHLAIILSEDFKDVSRDFFNKARKFGAELSMSSIYQGLRNVWIMNGLQLIMNRPVEITPAVFAYSMMYPYSDNYLDDPEINSTDKKRFSDRFKMRLMGQNIRYENNTEKQLWELVCMIEEQYDRVRFNHVYESLYAIHAGQTKSIQLIGDQDTKMEEVIHIGFEKGGTSVLADGYLVAGDLTQEEESALFAYGVYLQLLDDIQDIKEDVESSVKTAFTSATTEEMGALVNRTIHFGREVMDEMNCFPAILENDFIGLMNRSIETMLIESVGLNHESYAPDYVKTMEEHSPLQFSFVREKKKAAKSQRMVLFEKYFSRTEMEEVV